MTPTATRFLVEEAFGPEHILLWRFTGGGLLSLFIIGALRPRLPSRREMPRALALGLFGVLGFNVPLVFGVDRIEGGIAALLLGMQPGFTALFAVLWLREHIRPRMVVGLAIALAGTSMVALSGPIGVEVTTSYLIGCGLVLTAALFYALYTVTARPYLGDQIPAPAVAMIGTTAAFPIILPLGADGYFDALGSLSWEGWFAAILLAAGSSVFAPILYNVGLSLGTASRAGMFLYLNPVIGSVTSVIFLGERLSAVAIAGGALVILGVAVATLNLRALRPRHSV